MSNTPSDAEIISVMRDGYNCRYNDEADHVDFARAVIAKWGTPQPADCTRSHPHEDMSDYCLLRTEIARLANENARLKASQPVVREPLTDKQSHALLERMATEADQWAEGLSYEPTREQLAGWCVAFIQREIQAAHGIKGGQHGTDN